LSRYGADEFEYGVDEFEFQHSDMDSLVNDSYSVVARYGSNFTFNVLFPSTVPGVEINLRGKWLEAVQRLANADAAFAVFVGESQAIPAEAALALNMGLPLLVSAVDTYFIEPFKESGVPIVEPRSGLDTFEKGLGDFLASLNWL
jgi:hypothetical protein